MANGIVQIPAGVECVVVMGLWMALSARVPIALNALFVAVVVSVNIADDIKPL